MSRKKRIEKTVKRIEGMVYSIHREIYDLRRGIPPTSIQGADFMKEFSGDSVFVSMETKSSNKEKGGDLSAISRSEQET